MTQAPGFAPAKLNLTLHVTGQRSDGYHLLDSLVVFADVGDTLTARPADTWGLSITGPCAKGVPNDDTNLVMTAAKWATSTPHHMTLDKHLPMAAGIGGGSSDAAAAIRLCGGAHEGAGTLGADVPVCLAGPGPVRMRGVGDKVSSLPNLPPLWVVLVNPGVAVETPRVFAALTHKINPAMADALPRFPTAATVIAWLKRQRNDLIPPARRLAPQIDHALEALRPAPFVTMSGSGATCLGLCMTARAADKLAGDIRNAHPDWWVAAARVLEHGS